MSSPSRNPDIELSELREGFDDVALNDTIRSIENSLNAINLILQDLDTRVKALE